MNRLRHPFLIFASLFFTGLACIALGQANNPNAGRDPFWPVGYHGKHAKNVRPSATATPLPKGMTWEQKLAIARQEAAKLTEHLVKQGTKGTLRMGNRLHIIIGKNFYAQGDSIKIDRNGTEYRLVITTLTEDNIQLEPARIERGGPEN